MKGAAPVSAILRSRLAVVDDHPLFRRGLAVVLRNELDLEVVAEAGSAAEARGLATRIELDLAVVDVLMPHTSGVTVISELLEHQPRCRVLALSVLDDPCVIADLLRLGTCGFAHKAQPVHEIIDAIRQVLGGIRYLPPAVSRDAVDAALVSGARPAVAKLTPRELEVLELVIRGLGNDAIADQLCIARRTAETHHQRLMKKLSAHSLVEIQRMAALHGGRT